MWTHGIQFRGYHKLNLKGYARSQGNVAYSSTPSLFSIFSPASAFAHKFFVLVLLSRLLLLLTTPLICHFRGSGRLENLMVRLGEASLIRRREYGASL
jgi:hypothetical protein